MMSMHSMIRNVLLIASLLLAPHLQAQEPVLPIAFKGLYEFGMLGMTFGRMGVEAEQNAAEYRIVSDIELSGIAKLFMQHKSHTEVRGTGADFVYSDINYETHYQIKKKKKHVKLVSKDGVYIEEVVEPFNSSRPKVPPEIKNKALDPLSFLLHLRTKLAAAMAAKATEFSLLLFEGRNVTRIDVLIENDSKLLNYKGRKVPVIEISLRRKPVAGFTESELKEFDPKEPPLYMDVSKDERLLPLVVKTKVWLGTLTGTLVKECGAGESCLLGIK
jgi:hypothetical protein